MHPRDGILLISLDIEQFSDRVVFYQQVAELVAYIKSCPPAPGYPEVFVPGELEYRTAQEHLKNGIHVDDNVWQQIQQTAAKLNAVFTVHSAMDGSPPRMHSPPVNVARDELPA